MSKKTWTRLAFYTIVLGWFGFMWLVAWGVCQTSMIRVIIGVSSLSLCIIGSFLVSPIIQDDDLFKSIDELDELKYKYRETIKRLEDKIKSL